MINSIAPTQIPTLKEVDPKADMRCDIPIRLHYCSESHHEYQSQKAQISVGAISPDDDIEERLEQSQLTLSVEASRYLLAHISYAYFDYGIDVVHPSALPYKGDGYLSLSNSRYIGTDLNNDYIKDLSLLEHDEIRDLVQWMKKYKEEGWYLVGLHDIHISGELCENIQFTLFLSPYVFALEDRLAALTEGHDKK
ncbi:hypothetical protein AB4130_25235 [Vibrio sp. 10N.286.54.A9]|uniref:hypothetical protein n=4 Tax=Vibrio TaxID=662 RepID=UPI00355265D2